MTEDKKPSAESLETMVSKYNNALQCIVLTADLALLDLDETSSVYECLKEIKQAAMKAAPPPRDRMPYRH